MWYTVSPGTPEYGQTDNGILPTRCRYELKQSWPVSARVKWKDGLNFCRLLNRRRRWSGIRCLVHWLLLHSVFHSANHVVRVLMRSSRLIVHFTDKAQYLIPVLSVGQLEKAGLCQDERRDPWNSVFLIATVRSGRRRIDQNLILTHNSFLWLAILFQYTIRRFRSLLHFDSKFQFNSQILVLINFYVSNSNWTIQLKILIWHPIHHFDWIFYYDTQFVVLTWNYILIPNS